MNKFLSAVPPEFLATLNMNGLRGRMLRLPSFGSSRREILYVYGHRSSIESVYGYVQLLREFGVVTVPDLPGLGGMESFYKLGEVPTLDTMADYLASFVKLRYRRRRLTIIGQGYGFLIVTRMLQRYPEITGRVDALLSMDGFAHHDDVKKNRMAAAAYWASLLLIKNRLLARVGRNLLLNPSLLRRRYQRMYRSAHYEHLSEAQRRAGIAMEVWLWRVNDFRTQLHVAYTMLSVNNCKVRVPLPVWQMFSGDGLELDEGAVEQRLRVVYSHYHSLNIPVDRLMFSGIVRPPSPATAIPRKLRRLLQKKS